ncbi:hypothetical protein CRG98_043513 [Punica granatum]|uniref:Uncharacterized protein n=1 Tax=Punica granatum TaxID=22663 RepID=A0A2I0HX42_PUNGR|nr:hypothetical protein CRG98_043513 [Punica granatum]
MVHHLEEVPISRGMKKLEVLSGNRNRWLSREVPISDEVLSLSSLRVLRFRGIKSLPASELKELDSISSLRKLEKMNLHSLKIYTLPEKIGAFLRHLKELDIHYCHKLKSLPTLPSSPSVLRIGTCNSLERLPDLSNLKNLSILEVMQCHKLREIEGLGNLLSLKDLRTDYCPLTKLDGLKSERLKSLTVLSAAWSEVERLPNLFKLKNLKSLSVLGSRKLVEIGGLSSLLNLKMLCIDNCRSLELLPELLPSLEKLFLRYCVQFSEIEAVAELESLQELNINRCRSLRKLPNLSNLQRLQRFNMRDCESIVEIPRLEELSSLQELNTVGCKALKLPDLSKQQSNGL